MPERLNSAIRTTCARSCTPRAWRRRIRVCAWTTTWRWPPDTHRIQKHRGPREGPSFRALVLYPAGCGTRLLHQSFVERAAQWNDLTAIGAIGDLGEARVQRRNSGQDADVAAQGLGRSDAEIAGGEQEEGDPQQQEDRPDALT